MGRGDILLQKFPFTGGGQKILDKSKHEKIISFKNAVQP